MATQITATLPTLDFPLEADYPTQEDWAAFSAAAEENFGILGGSWSEQMQLWKTEANAMSIELNNNSTIAQGLANYQGDWISQGYTLGQTVSVSGIYYVCKLTHATGQNPTAGGSLYWNLAIGNWNLKVNTDMSGYSSKATPVDDDLLPLSDSASAFGIKKLSWANLKATLSNLFAPLLSPAFTGNPTAPTQTAGNNSTRLATTAYVDGKMVLGTSVNSTSGTSIDFTGIPSWVKRITVMFNAVSTNGTSIVQVQLGSGSVQTTGYNSVASGVVVGAASTNTIYSTTGITIGDSSLAAYSRSGNLTINRNGNSYTSNGSISLGSAGHQWTTGSVTISGALDRIRITTVNGTDTFDAGSINILYEG